MLSFAFNILDILDMPCAEPFSFVLLFTIHIPAILDSHSEELETLSAQRLFALTNILDILDST